MTKMLLPALGLLLILTACSSEDIQISPRYNYLALGDSYTIGEGVAVNEGFPQQLAEELNAEGYLVADPRVVARTGWTTADLSGALASANLDPPYDLVSLLIGVNNQYQGRSTEEYRGEFSALLESAIAYAGGREDQVLVVSIPDYGYTPFGRSRQPQISSDIDEFNAINREVTLARGVQYVDVTPISRRGLAEPELVASDGLHPSARQYQLWVEQLLPVAIAALE